MHWVFIVACKFLAVARRIQFPNQGSNLGPSHWECRVLATGPPGKSQEQPFLSVVFPLF